MGAEKLEKVEASEIAAEKASLEVIKKADPKSVDAAVEKNGSFAKAKEASPGPKPAPETNSEKKEKPQEKTEEEKKEELQQKATDLILSEIKKYDFNEEQSTKIFDLLSKKYNREINGYGGQELATKYKKIDSPKNIFGKDLKEDMTEIIADYNRIIILNDFLYIGDIDEPTKKLIESMLKETSDSDVNTFGLVLNTGAKTKIVKDVTQKINDRNTKNPKKQLIKFDNITKDFLINGQLQTSTVEGKGTIKTINQSIPTNDINDKTISTAIDAIHNSMYKDTATTDIIRLQIPQNYTGDVDNIQKLIAQKLTSSGRPGNIVVERTTGFKSHINISREGKKAYRTGLGDRTFEVPVEKDQAIQKRVSTLLQEYRGKDITITIKIPSTGNEKVRTQIKTIVEKLPEEDQSKIEVIPVEGLQIEELQNVDISGEVAEYGEITSKVKLPYNKIANKMAIETSLSSQLNDILKDPKCTIIGGEIYGSASYQHTIYTPNEKLENFVNNNESKFSIQNKTVDGKQVQQQSTTDTGPGSVTNNPTLARDRALTFLDYINTLPGANNKKIPNIASIAVAYGVNGPTLQEAMKNIGTEDNVDPRLQPIFEDYQYTTLSLKYKKVQNIETEIFPLTDVATSTEGFQISMKSETDQKVKKTRRTGIQNFWGDGTIQIPQGKSLCPAYGNRGGQ